MREVTDNFNEIIYVIEQWCSSCDSHGEDEQWIARDQDMFGNLRAASIVDAWNFEIHLNKTHLKVMIDTNVWLVAWGWDQPYLQRWWQQYCFYLQRYRKDPTLMIIGHWYIYQILSHFLYVLQFFSLHGYIGHTCKSLAKMVLPTLI